MSTIFVSHASEDKAAFVRPLAHALKRQGLKVWFDEFSLRPGDSLRRSIDRGLADCTAGLVVLSPAFFAKEWPQRELDALFTGEIVGRTKLIPIWHNVDLAAVAAASPLLADRFALRADLGPEAIAEKIAEEFPPPAKITGAALADRLEQYQYPGTFGGEALHRGCQHRFLQMNAFKEEFMQVLEQAFAERFDEELGDFPPEAAKWLRSEEERLRLKHRILDDVYLTSDEPVRESHLGSYMTDLCEWVSGTLSREASAELVHDLDLDELDEYYILLEVPNFAISSEQRFYLEQALIEVGCGYGEGYKTLSEICAKLRASDDRG
jgi:hypothetical protein